MDLHRHPGHPAGHLRDVRRGGRQAVRRHPRRHADADRRLRRHGRRAAARRHHERRRLPDRRRGPHPARPPGARPLPGRGRRLPGRRGRSGPRREAGRAGPLSVGVVGNAAEVFPELLRRGVEIDIVTDQTSAHDPLAYLPVGVELAEARRLRRREAGRVHRPGPRVDGQARRGDGRLPRRRRRGVRLRQLDPRRGAARRLRSAPSTSPASCPRTSGRCSARARARSAGRRSPATRPTSRPPTGRSSTCSRRTSRWPAGSSWPASGSPSRACRPGSAGSATASGTRRACGSTTWSPPASCPRRW